MKRSMGALILLVFCLAASAALAQAAPLEKADFTLAYAGKTYTLLSNPADLIAAVEQRDGAAMTVTEADSCIFSGKDKEFLGRELLLGTYPAGKGGSDRLETIVIFAGDAVTVRGIGIGSNREAVISTYGAGMEDYDQLLYAVGKPYESPTLIFQLDLETDVVTGIYLMACSA